MSASVQRGGDVLSLPRPSRGRARPRSRALVAVVGLAIAAALAALLAELGAEGESLHALPAQQRAALVERAVDDLRQFCGDTRPEALREHCRERASFAAQFGECTGECEVLVRRQLTPVPTR